MRPYTDPDTLESDRKGMFLAGVLVAGMHTNEIFIENGRFHGKIIAEAIARESYDDPTDCSENWRRLRRSPKKINSKVDGVMIGAQTYSFRDRIWMAVSRDERDRAGLCRAV